ncbi:MAG TPA: hypothetical protein VII99_03955 [Bacteroidia bacterium]
MLLFKVFPENISTYGNEIDNLFWLIFAISAVAFIVSLFVLLYPLYSNHHSKKKKADYITGEKKSHFKWVAIAVVIMALSDFAIMFAEHGTWAKIEEDPVSVDFHIAVTGRQWNWIFTYPGKDGILYTADDITIDDQNSELHVPVNKNIVFDLKSRDVVHSFFLKNIRLKQDAVPGRTIKRWFNCIKEGKYEIACSEICGVLHSQMRNWLVVDSQENFDNYINALYNQNQPKK